MKKIYYLILLSCIFPLLLCSCKKEQSKGQKVDITVDDGTVPVDANATKETKALFHFLHHQTGKGTLFGHQDELLVGGNHPRGTGGSDTYDMIGDFPALYGFDIANIEQGLPENNADLDFDSIQSKIKYIYSKGGIITLSWAVNNPVMISEPVDGDGVTNTVQKLFSNQKYLDRFNGWLDKLALFFGSLKTANGTLIPILFRPYHECNGNWFWWGTEGSTDDEFIHLYVYTVNYLKNHGVHNLLYVYCTDKFDSENEYLKRYPGDEYVDVLGFDCYDYPSYHPENSLVPMFESMAETVSKLASQRNKIPALTETGFKNVPVANWWTNTLHSSIHGSGLCYLMVWGNYGDLPNTYWGAFEGQVSAKDFATFSANSDIVFLSQLSRRAVYGTQK